MDDILKSAWGDLLNENEKLATLLDEKDARIERLEAALTKARKFIDYELPCSGKTMVAELDAALAGKSHT